MPGVTGEMQALSFLYACGLGFLLGLYYELFRTVRLLIPPSVGVCVFQDVFFCLSAALISFFCILGFADGVFYPYLLFGEMLGFLVFYGTLGNVLHTVFAGICRVVYGVYTYAKQKILSPLWRLAKEKCGWCGKIWKIQAKKLQKKRKKARFFSKKP